MLGKKTENPRPVSLAEVKAMLLARASEPDFGYEQQLSLDYSKKFCKLSLEDARALSAGLSKIEALLPDSVAKIVDILPEHAPTLQAILAKEKISLPEKDLEKTLELVHEARAKMIVIEEIKPEAAQTAEEGAAAPQSPAQAAPQKEENEKPAKESKDGKETPAKEEKKAKADDAKGEEKGEKPRRKKKESKD
ncbi:MAG: hypothetical protein V1728_00730 [Candidatus Micrarchaeota archaeon]